jgi:flagellar basal body rod protein FlgG
MNVSLYAAAAAMNANAHWQETIADNLTSGSIPGFKKQDTYFNAIPGGLLPASASNSRFSLPAAASATNFLQGELKPTGTKTDLALEGPGFFEVQMPDGTMAYTRNGEFKLTPQGELTTKEGYPVMGEKGPMKFDPRRAEEITFSATGAAAQGIDAKGVLKLAEFQDPRQLVQVGGGYYLANDASPLTKPSGATSLRQGLLESSNASPLTEMGSLIFAMRQFEANQRVIQSQDERMGKAITELSSIN